MQSEVAIILCFSCTPPITQKRMAQQAYPIAVENMGESHDTIN